MELVIICISMSNKRDSDSSPKPVEMGKEYDVEITVSPLHPQSAGDLMDSSCTLCPCEKFEEV